MNRASLPTLDFSEFRSRLPELERTGGGSDRPCGGRLVLGVIARVHAIPDVQCFYAVVLTVFQGSPVRGPSPDSPDSLTIALSGNHFGGQLSSNSILLVEDNPSDVALTKRALARAHIANDLIVAEDGQEALDYLFATGTHTGRDASQQPMLTLLDLKLPKIPGLEVLRQIRANSLTRRIPVVILTSSNEERDIAASYDLGSNSYIRKPVDFGQFVDAVRQLGLYWLVLNHPPPIAEVRMQ